MIVIVLCVEIQKKGFVIDVKLDIDYLKGNVKNVKINLALIVIILKMVLVILVCLIIH